ncbi:hypothetical protein H2200_013016 [Cladophialophora chaetospira]|uniref:Rhodanese domain-containing protein n=1 Tax=Cladophialophora chaetospira TaxID=386627 RepID=A0AA38WWJ9_9EURO|nr:hypothetical protein H2200_013016 [Cladophialophora chaetospira]
MSSTDEPVMKANTLHYQTDSIPNSTSISKNQPRNSPTLIPAPSLASSRYNRQLLLSQLRLRGQEYLLSSRVLIIGLGGLGSPAALYLAGAGIGTLGLMDADNVEVSNLHRQIVHTEAAARSGMSKVRSAAARCKELNSEIEYICHEASATASNILDIVARYDLVLDCTDNPATRYLISDACVILGKVLVSGAAQKGDGMLIVLNSPPFASGVEEKGPCYRCVFPRPPAPETVRGCSEIGILGPVVGMIGTLMAGEAIKIISSGGHLPQDTQHETLNGTAVLDEPQQKKHTMLLYNTYASDPRSTFRTITLRGRRKDCLACGDHDALKGKGLSRITAEVISQGRLDYQAFCGILEDVKLLSEQSRIDAAAFLDKHAHKEHGHRGRKRKRKHVVVDVREEHEFELGPKIVGSVNIPLSKILKNGSGAFDELLAERKNVDGGDQEVHIPVAGGETYPNPYDQQSIVDNTASGPDGGMLDQESHVSAPRNEDSWTDLRKTMNGFEAGPDGGQINQESHMAVIEERSFPNAPDRGPQTYAPPPDGGMLDQESHVPVTRQADFPIRPVGGAIDQESHIPVTRQSTFFSSDFPARPATEAVAEDNSDDDSAPGVYFVCQRGNDSQIAAQKLIESFQNDRGRTRKWGWIGDVKGGFLAMERHATM